MRKRYRTLRNKKPQKNSLDKTIVFFTLGLTAFGILAVTDASAPQAMAVFSDPYYFTKQQIMWAAIGIFSMFIISLVPYYYWKSAVPFVLGATLILLVLVILPGFGTEVLGARRWISIGPATLQPSELAKFSMALAGAYFLDKQKPWYFVATTLALLVGLIMLQPDLGTAIVVTAIGMSQLFIFGLPLIVFAGLSLAGGLLGALLILISDYRKQRLMTFLQSSLDPLGTSYHMRQILIALGSGGLFGAGIGQSRQKHLFLPETASDSVFAVLAEEIGFVGSVVLIIVLTIYVMRLFRVARKAPDTFSFLLAGGIAAWVGSQMFLNLSSMVAITPLTGIPLPFFSYGGSSLVTILFGVGIILNITKYHLREDRENGQ